MAGRINDDFMTAEYDGWVIATARYCKDAPDDGHGGVERFWLARPFVHPEPGNHSPWFSRNGSLRATGR
jgi:hypothetical protein